MQKSTSFISQQDIDDLDEIGTTHRKGIRQVIVKEYSDSEDSTPIDDSSDDEPPRVLPKGEIPAEYWHIQKLVKYIKTGNQTVTVVALTCLKDHDLTVEINQLAIQNIGGLEILVNLLEVKDLNSKIGALHILKIISDTNEVMRLITDLGVVPLLVQNLCYPARDLQILASETLANVCKLRKARRIVRKCDGIPKLVDLLDIPETLLQTAHEELQADDQDLVNIAIGSAKALWSISASRKNKEIMMRSGVVGLLAKLLKSCQMDVIIPTVGIISQCAADPSYQVAIQTKNMIKDIVKHLSTEEYPELRKYCSAAIFACAEDTVTRDMVRHAGGLDPLIKMSKDPKIQEDKELLAAVVGALWKCAKTKENVERYDQLNTVNALVLLLKDESEDVLSHVVGALSECVKFPHNREIFRRANGIPPTVNLLNFTHPLILENVPLVIRESAKDPDSMRIIEELDGVRLIWSLLKNESPRIQENAAWALVPCVRNALESGEMVRSFVGGLELIVKLLNSKETRVLAAVCSAIAEVAKDRENLAVMTDHQVVPLLANLVNTDDPLLREHLACAIAYCCSWGANCKNFGKLGAITPLVTYMTEKNLTVHRTTALALFHLSTNSFNCITMHESGIVPFLLKSVASEDELLQESAAGCLSNIRRLALEAETYHLITKGKDRPESDDDDDDDDD